MSFEPVTLEYSDGSTITLSREGDLVTANAVPNSSELTSLHLPIPSGFAPIGNLVTLMINEIGPVGMPGQYGLSISEDSVVGGNVGMVLLSLSPEGPYLPASFRWIADPDPSPDPEQIEDSILHDVKQMVGQELDDTTYDLDIKTHINTVFLELQQIGVGPDEGFSISTAADTWAGLIGTDKNLNAVKSFVYIKVRLLFDPPTTGPLMSSLQAQADRIEWRLMVQTDPPINQNLE